jgi:hypothetical protein
MSTVAPRRGYRSPSGEAIAVRLLHIVDVADVLYEDLNQAVVDLYTRH